MYFNAPESTVSITEQIAKTAVYGNVIGTENAEEEILQQLERDKLEDLNNILGVDDDPEEDNINEYKDSNRLEEGEGKHVFGDFESDFKTENEEEDDDIDGVNSKNTKEDKKKKDEIKEMKQPKIMTPEDEEYFKKEREERKELLRMRNLLQKTLKRFDKSTVPMEEQKSLTVALIGPPNAGKSTLLNYLTRDKVCL